MTQTKEKPEVAIDTSNAEPRHLSLATEALGSGSQQIGDIMLNTDLLAQAGRMADQMAEAKVTVPAHLRGNPGDCYAIVLQALQWRMNPFVVAQKTHVVNGTLGYEAQLVNALITAMAPTKDRVNYEWFGDWDAYRANGRKNENGLGVRVFATMKGESKPRIHTLYLSDVTTRNSPLWKTKPDLQLAYLGVKQWARLHCPDVILGIYTPDELEDAPAMRDVTPRNAEPEMYPDADFQANLPKWRQVIEAKRKTADELIVMIESKAQLTDEQKTAIRNLEPIEGETE